MSDDTTHGPKRYPPRRKMRQQWREVDAPSQSQKAQKSPSYHPADDERPRPSGEHAKTTSPADGLQDGTDTAVEQVASHMGVYDGEQAAPAPQEITPPHNDSDTTAELQPTPQPDQPPADATDESPAAPEPPQQHVDQPTDSKAMPQTAPTPGETVDDLLATGGASAISQSAMEARQRRRRRRRIKTSLIMILVVGLVVAVSVATISFFGGMSLFTGAKDYPGPGEGEVIVTIPAGATGTDIAGILKEQDVVASEKAFINAYKNNSLSQGIQAGSYKLKKKMKATGALAALLDPASKAEVTVTIVPGSTVEQIKERIIGVRGFTEADVENALKDPEAVGLPDVANGNYEGWLAPETYTIEPDMEATDVFAMMIGQTKKELDELGVPPEKQQDVLIRSSIVQKEGDMPQYYGKIARVVDNRINKPEAETRGLLQMDCTVAYGVGKAGTGLLIDEKDKAKDTPYNTYLHKGLPPTPIANASRDVIKAVVNPPQGDWLYYVTVNLNTGETKFATTLEEQERNVKEFRQFCKDNPDVCKS